MIPLTFRQLEVFVRVAEAGSFRRCAEQLSISQSSVGEHVRALESQLDCVLFDRRRGAAAVLTQVGEQVFRRSQASLAEAEDLLAAFDQESRPGRQRRIRIGAHGFIGINLSKRIAEFLSANANVDVQLERRSFADVVSGLAQSEIEIGYFLARGPVPEMESFVAWEEPIGFFTGASHPLAARPSVDPTDLCGAPFCYLPMRTHLRGEIDGILRSLQISGCPAAITTDDHILIVEKLTAGDSFACIFSDWMAPYVENGSLAKLHFPQPVPPIQIRYAVRGVYREDRTVRALLDTLNLRP
jgi:DNA-binding transcriptional LysR family regulator